ncbi:MAG TPA: S41 family peptidase [Candidatus Woesebacteria bacterium]|nr:S41 family peptidase [Candidatus Woesebacteria bacterium]HNS94368.1 S41 family peptidase [Candidatus Woesebacteria bacterium]
MPLETPSYSTAEDSKPPTNLPKRQAFLSYVVYGALCAFLLIAGYRLGEYQALRGLQDQNIGTIIQNNIENVFKGTKPSTAQIETLNGNNRDVDFKIFWEAWEIFEKRFVDRARLDTNKMFYSAVKGLIESAEDPYTFFLTPTENRQSKDSLGGKFEGIGAQLGTKDGRIVVIAPIKNSPAIRAGIRAGDIITAVDGVETEGKSLVEVVSKIRGTSGTNVTLTIERNTKELDITIKRAEITVESIENEYTKGIAHVKLGQFGTRVKEEWDALVPEWQRKYERGEIQGLVIDVRNNPGGLLDACVYMTGDFLARGKLIVKQVGIEDTIEYTVTRSPRLEKIPVVMLIDKGSASASEIMAGALRDHKRAQLVGEKSFGKGSVQGTFDLSDGSGMHVTVAKWLLPNGEWINGTGIEPDITVENPEIDSENTVLADETDLQLQKAIELLTK